MTVTLRKGPRENIPEINYKHNPLSKRQLQQVYFPHNHEGEKKSKKTYIHKMLSIPNYYRSDDDQNDNEKSNPI